jgi:hypothetical protein
MPVGSQIENIDGKLLATLRLRSAGRLGELQAGFADLV